MQQFFQSTLFFSIILGSFLAKGQDVPLGTLPMHFNSSFAGEAETARFSSNLFYANGTGIGNNIAAFYSYDQFIPAIRSGIGISGGHSHDLQIVGETFNYIGLAIAPKFSTKGKWTISPSLDIFYNSLDSKYRGFNEFSSRAGILLNTKRFYMGYSVYLYDRIRINEGDYLRFLYNEAWHYSQTYEHRDPYFDGFSSHLQMGYTFQRSADSKFSFTSQVLIGIRNYTYRNDLLNRVSRPIDLDKFMLNFRHNKFLWGISDVGIHLGWQAPKLRIMVFNNVQRYLDHDITGRILSSLSVRYTLSKQKPGNY